MSTNIVISKLKNEKEKKRNITLCFPGAPTTALTKRRLYNNLFLARPFGCFFFSTASTFGV